MKLYLFNRTFGKDHPSVPVMLEIPTEGGMFTEHLTSSPRKGIGDLNLLADDLVSAVRVELGYLPAQGIALNFLRPFGDYWDIFYSDSRPLLKSQAREFEGALLGKLRIRWVCDEECIV